MKLRFFIIPALLATVLFAQGPGGPGGFGARRQANGTNTPGTTPTPPSPTQLGTREVQMIAAFVGLDAAQTTQLLGTSLVADLGTEQTNLQTYAKALRADYTALANSIAGGTAPLPTTIPDIGTQNSNALTARTTAAEQVVTALTKSLSPPLTSAQSGKLPGLVNTLLSGGVGGPGGFRGGPRF